MSVSATAPAALPATRIALRTAPTLAQWVGALATAQAHGLPGLTRVDVEQPSGDARFKVPSKRQRPREERRSYTVHVRQGHLDGCTCDAGRSGRLCAHAASVALWLYARDTGADLGQLMAVPADVLARRLWTAYGPRRAEGSH